MFQDLRTDGYDRQAAQLWLVGLPYDDASLAPACEGLEHACFVADEAYLEAYTPDQDDVYLNDATGHGIKWGNLAYGPLDVPANYDALDARVRSLLLPPGT
jgi:hypothetical protein